MVTPFTSCTQPVKPPIDLPLYENIIPNNIPNHGLKELVTYNKLTNGKTFSFVRQISEPKIFVYLPDQKTNTGTAIIICPGGGYGGLAIDHEGHDMAKKFASEGIAGIVLKYRCPDPKIVTNKTIVPLQDAQRAMILVKENASKWSINPDRIGILGSSAGGHLAATAATHFNQVETDNPKKVSLRPAFAILNYPVISFIDGVGHNGSRDNLIGPLAPDQINGDLVHLYSNEHHVTSATPPIFITHAQDDNVVPISNSILFIASCQQYGVPMQSFFYAKGGHGYGLDNPIDQKEWIDVCIGWLKQTILKK